MKTAKEWIQQRGKGTQPRHHQSANRTRNVCAMKPEEQIKALAELDGLTRHDESYQFGGELCVRFVWKRDGKVVYTGDFFLPNYLHSYDAIIPLLQKQLKDNNISDKFFGEIEQPTGCTGEDLLSRTPAQLCEALLRATGKWQN